MLGHPEGLRDRGGDRFPLTESQGNALNFSNLRQKGRARSVGGPLAVASGQSVSVQFLRFWPCWELACRLGSWPGA